MLYSTVIPSLYVYNIKNSGLSDNRNSIFSFIQMSMNSTSPIKILIIFFCFIKSKSIFIDLKI